MARNVGMNIFRRRAAATGGINSVRKKNSFPRERTIFINE